MVQVRDIEPTVDTEPTASIKQIKSNKISHKATEHYTKLF